MLAVESDISVISATVLMSSNTLISFKPQTTCQSLSRTKWQFELQWRMLSSDCCVSEWWYTEQLFEQFCRVTFFEQCCLGAFPLRMGNTFLSGYFRWSWALCLTWLPALTATLPKVARCIISLRVCFSAENVLRILNGKFVCVSLYVCSLIEKKNNNNVWKF